MEPDITAEKIAELKRAYEASTQGEWYALIRSDTMQVSDDPVHNNSSAVVHWSGFNNSGKPLKQRKANARFIALAHNHFPALLRLVQKGIEAVEEPQENPIPIGKCVCGAPVYIKEGYCGVCGR